MCICVLSSASASVSSASLVSTASMHAETPLQWCCITCSSTSPAAGVTHWQSPRFFAYFPASGSFPSILAEMLMSALNMVGFSWSSSPVSTELEMVGDTQGWCQL